MKYWNRFIYRSEHERFPMWLYLMFVTTLANGIAFTFFGHSASTQASVLFQLTSGFGDHYVSVWGIVAIAAVVMSLSNLLIRYRPISSLGPYLGYIAWFYAAMVYLTHGYILQLISAFVWLVFWFMHHMRLVEYRHNVDNGLETPPK